MRVPLFLVSFCVILTPAFFQGLSQPRETCDPSAGEGSWKEDCNWCRCSDGQSVCTKIGCLPGSTVEDPSQVECRGNPRWKINNLWCTCVAGRASCEGSNVVTQIPDCSPDRAGSWRRECNWCRCTSTGFGACTRRGCIPGFDVREPAEPECRGDPRWKVNDQWCSCIDGKASCGENIAVAPVTQIPDCSPDRTGSWRRECNWCQCTSTGFGACTRRGCIPGFDVREPLEPECRGDPRWKVNGQWCSCIDGRASCGENIAVAPVIEKTDGQKQNTHEVNCQYTGMEDAWRSSCNWCRCSLTGQSACTLRGCLPGDDIQQNLPECKGNAKWKVKCNWCSCHQGKSVCTQAKCS